MKDFKGTKGKCTFSPQTKTTIVDNEIRGCHQAQVWDSNGKSLVIVEPTKDESIATANAELISDSFTTINKCNLLPSELLEQRDELLKALTNLVKQIPADFKNNWLWGEIEKAKEAIQKATS